MNESRPALHVTLPYPPRLGAYYRPIAMRSKSGFACAKIVRTGVARRYRDSVVLLLRRHARMDGPMFTGTVRCDLMLCPPDRRVRDLDNCNKAILDSLTWAGVWRDDAQVVEMTSQWGPVVRGGELRLIVTEI